jgi:hypothetical protein
MKIKKENSCDVHFKLTNEIIKITGHVKTPISYWTILSPPILQDQHTLQVAHFSSFFVPHIVT